LGLLRGGSPGPTRSFQTLRDAGREPAEATFYSDHHAYTRGDVEKLIAWARDHRLDALLTTEKDAVKLSRLDIEWPLPVRSVLVEMQMLDGGERVLEELIDRVLAEHDRNVESEEPQPHGEASETRPEP